MVAGDAHHPARERHRPRAHDSERARRDQIRRVVPGAVPRQLRRPRRQRAGHPARARRLRLVRDSNLDWRAGARHAAAGRVAGVGGRAWPGLDRVRHLLAGAGGDHRPRPRRHQEAGGLVGAAAARRRRAAARLGDRPRRRPRTRPQREHAPADQPRPVLADVSGGAHRQRGLLGHAQPEHSRLHALRAQPAVAGARPGVGTTAPR